MEMNSVLGLMVLCLISDARRIDILGKESYVMKYSDGGRIIPVLVDLDQLLQCEYVSSIGPDGKRRAISLYDFKQDAFAFKDFKSKQCFVGTIRNHTLPEDKMQLRQFQDRTMFSPPVSPVLLVGGRISSSQLRLVSGERIAAFCQGFTSYFVKNEKPLRRVRRNVADSNSGNVKGKFTHHSYGHYGHQSTNYAHYGHESYIDGQLGKNGVHRQRVHQYQVRSDGPGQPTSDQLQDSKNIRTSQTSSGYWPQNGQNIGQAAPSSQVHHKRTFGDNTFPGGSGNFLLRSEQGGSYQVNLPLGLRAGSSYTSGVGSRGIYGTGDQVPPQTWSDFRKTDIGTGQQSCCEPKTLQPGPFAPSYVPGYGSPSSVPGQAISGVSPRDQVGQTVSTPHIIPGISAHGQVIPGIPSSSQTVPQISQADRISSGIPSHVLPGISQPSSTMPGLTSPSRIMPPVPQPQQAVPDVSQSSQTSQLQTTSRLTPGISPISQTIPGLLQPSQTTSGVYHPSQLVPGISQPGVAVPEIQQPSQITPGMYHPRQLEPGIQQTSMTLHGMQQPSQINPGIYHQRPGPSQPRSSIPQIPQPSQIHDGFAQTGSTRAEIPSGQHVPSIYAPSRTASDLSATGPFIPGITSPDHVFRPATGQAVPTTLQAGQLPGHTLQGLRQIGPIITESGQAIPSPILTPNILQPFQTHDTMYPNVAGQGARVNGVPTRGAPPILPSSMAQPSQTIVRPGEEVPSMPYGQTIPDRVMSRPRYPEVSQPGQIIPSDTNIPGSYVPEHIRPELSRAVQVLPETTRQDSARRVSQQPGQLPAEHRTSWTGYEQPLHPGGIVPGPSISRQEHGEGTSAARSRYGGQDTAASQTQVQTGLEGTAAEASSQGRQSGLGSQTQVQGGYMGNGSFSAQAQSGFTGGLTQSQVRGSRQGGTSSSSAHVETLGSAQSQVQVLQPSGVSSGTAQGRFVGGSTQVQAQSGKSGGSAGAQSQSSGLSSSQVQVNVAGESVKASDTFQGGVSASVHGGRNSGQSQTQLQGGYTSGRTYVANAQGGYDVTKFYHPGAAYPGADVPALRPHAQEPVRSISTPGSSDQLRSDISRNGGRQATQRTVTSLPGYPSGSTLPGSQSALANRVPQVSDSTGFPEYRSEIPSQNSLHSQQGSSFPSYPPMQPGSLTSPGVDQTRGYPSPGLSTRIAGPSGFADQLRPYPHLSSVPGVIPSYPRDSFTSPGLSQFPSLPGSSGLPVLPGSTDAIRAPQPSIMPGSDQIAHRGQDYGDVSPGLAPYPPRVNGLSQQPEHGPPNKSQQHPEQPIPAGQGRTPTAETGPQLPRRYPSELSFPRIGQRQPELPVRTSSYPGYPGYVPVISGPDDRDVRKPEERKPDVSVPFQQEEISPTPPRYPEQRRDSFLTGDGLASVPSTVPITGSLPAMPHSSLPGSGPSLTRKVPGMPGVPAPSIHQPSGAPGEIPGTPQHVAKEQSCCQVLRNLKNRCCGSQSRDDSQPRCCTKKHSASQSLDYDEEFEADGDDGQCKVVKAICYIVYKPIGRARICKPTSTSTNQC